LFKVIAGPGLMALGNQFMPPKYLVFCSEKQLEKFNRCAKMVEKRA